MKHLFTVLLAILSISLTSVAAPYTMKGTVVDELGEKLTGVSVSVKGTARGTTTDLSGQFSLQVSNGETLQFSYVGYSPVNIKVNGQPSVEVKMAPAND